MTAPFYFNSATNSITPFLPFFSERETAVPAGAYLTALSGGRFPEFNFLLTLVKYFYTIKVWEQTAPVNPGGTINL